MSTTSGRHGRKQPVTTGVRGPSRIWRFSFLLLAISLVLAACASGTDDSPDSSGETAAATEDDGTDDSGDDGSDDSDDADAEPGETIKISAPLGLTGPVAGFANPYLNAMQFAVETINENGGIASLGGAQLELLVADSESDPQRAVELLRDMQGEAVAAVGPIASGLAVAAKPALIEIGIPWVGPTLEDSLTDDSDGTIFRAVSRFGDWGEGTMDFVDAAVDAGQIEVDSVGIVTIDAAPGPALRDVLVARAEDNGWTVETAEYNFTETRDFSPVVAQMRDADVDLIMGLNYPNDSILFAEAMTLQDWRPSEGFAWVAGGQYLNSFRDALGDDVTGWTVASYMSPATACDDLTGFADEFESRFGEPLTGLAGAGPAVIQTIASALEQAGSADPEAVRAALPEVTLDFCDGLYTMPGGLAFDENGDNERFVPAIVQLEGETDQPAVYPPDYASQEARWPAHDQAG